MCLISAEIEDSFVSVQVCTAKNNKYRTTIFDIDFLFCLFSIVSLTQEIYIYILYIYKHKIYIFLNIFSIYYI